MFHECSIEEAFRIEDLTETKLAAELTHEDSEDLAEEEFVDELSYEDFEEDDDDIEEEYSCV